MLMKLSMLLFSYIIANILFHTKLLTVKSTKWTEGGNSFQSQREYIQDHLEKDEIPPSKSVTEKHQELIRIQEHSTYN